jgi:hypothetical protein
MSERVTLGGRPRILPVFPLPNTVFFPATTMPLHIFEARYRALVRDVTEGEGLFVVALASGEAFADLGTVGRIRALEPLEDGRSNLELEGLERVRIAEVPGAAPYRQVRVESWPERVGTDDARVIAEARLDLLASYGALSQLLVGNSPAALLDNLPFDVVVNTASASLPVDAESRQRLLAVDSLLDRQRLALEYIAAVIQALSWLHVAKGADGALLH